MGSAAVAKVSPAQMLANFRKQSRLKLVNGGQNTYGLTNPIELKTADYLVEAITKTVLTLTFTNSATAASAAVTPADPDWPYSAVGPLIFNSDTETELYKADGRWSYLLHKAQAPAFWDRRTNSVLPTSVPASATATGTITVYNRVQLAASRANLIGLFLLQAQGQVATIDQTWKSVSQISAGLSLPANVTLTSVTGTMQLADVLYAVPASADAQPLPYLATSHRVQKVKDIKLGNETQLEYSFLQTGSVLRLGILLLNADGYRDVGNSLGLQTLQLQYGNSDYPINIGEDYLDVVTMDQHRYGPDPLWRQSQSGLPATHSPDGDGVYWFDRTANSPLDWINTDLYTSKTININGLLSATAPAGAMAQILIEVLIGPGAQK